MIWRKTKQEEGFQGKDAKLIRTKKPTPAATRECSFSGVLSSCFLVLKGGTDRGGVNPFLTLTQECWRVTLKKERSLWCPQVGVLLQGFLDPAFLQQLRMMILSLPGIERKAGLLRS